MLPVACRESKFDLFLVSSQFHISNGRNQNDLCPNEELHFASWKHHLCFSRESVIATTSKLQTTFQQQWKSASTSACSSVWIIQRVFIKDSLLSPSFDFGGSAVQRPVNCSSRSNDVVYDNVIWTAVLLWSPERHENPSSIRSNYCGILFVSKCPLFAVPLRPAVKPPR